MHVSFDDATVVAANERSASVRSGIQFAGSLPARDDSSGIVVEQEAAMAGQTLTNRVEILEQKVEGLEQLPDRVASLELQISQFREEVRVEFSSTRGEMMNRMDELHGIAMNRMNELHGISMNRMNELHGVAMNRIHELSTEMRVLHEEVISRIALLNEGLNHRRRMKRHPPKR